MADLNAFRDKLRWLRARAEESQTALLRSAAGGEALRAEELSATVEELYVTLEQLDEAGSQLALSETSLATERFRYQQLFDFAPDAYLVTDDAGLILEANQAAAEMLRVHTPASLVRKALVLFVRADSRAAFHMETLAASAGPVDVTRHLGLWLQPRAGAALPASIRIRASHAYGNGHLTLHWSIRDVSKLRELELAWDTDKERLKVAVDSLTAGLISTDQHGDIVLINARALEITAWSGPPPLGLSLGTIFRPLTEGTGTPCPDVAGATIESDARVAVSEARLVGRDGRERVISYGAAPMHDRAGQLIGTVVVFDDLTESRRLQEEAIKAQRLESVGLLAGGIAHDFNNLLTAIQGHITLARRTPEPDEAGRLLLEAEEATHQAHRLTQQLLTFARGGGPVRRTMHINGVLRDSCALATRGSGCSCQIDIAPDLWSADVDEGQIGQVISNLVINARQASPQGGVIAVAAENLDLPATCGLPLAPGPYLHITVQDRGDGMPREQLERVFDPYFTTKSAGTGLGLTVVHSVVTRHGGHIRLQSRPGDGTVAHVYLPALPDAASAPAPVAEPAAPRAVADRGSLGRLLVMDDQEIVRRVMAELLAYLGYAADLVSTGEEAVDAYQSARAEGRPYNAVLLDLTVAGHMGGVTALLKLKELDPDVVAVVCSGYSDDPVLAHFQDHGFRGILLKPFTLERISAVLQKLDIAPAPPAGA